MMRELHQTEYGLVRPLFRPLEQRPFVAGALAGIEASRMLVDDPVTPRTAFLLVRDTWGYLAGDSGNDVFNRALNQTLFAREIVPREVPLLQLTCSPEDWGGQLAVVCHPRQPIAEERHYLAARKLEYDWRAHVPAGFDVRFIDPVLLEQAKPEVPDDVQKLVAARVAADGRIAGGFGFAVLHKGEIVSYAMVDSVAEPLGEIFLFTAEAYRRRGLGTIATAATIEYGLSHRLRWINWDCQAENLGSLRAAQRLGLEPVDTYRMHYFFYD
jgi:RimJ/RimL family protein N-acetyltransferase